MKADPGTEAAVLDVLARVLDYYYARDVENLWPLFAQDPDLVLIGTGEHETSVGPGENGPAFHQDFSQIESVSVKRRGSVQCRLWRMSRG